MMYLLFILIRIIYIPLKTFKGIWKHKIYIWVRIALHVKKKKKKANVNIIVFMFIIVIIIRLATKHKFWKKVQMLHQIKPPTKWYKFSLFVCKGKCVNQKTWAPSNQSCNSLHKQISRFHIISHNPFLLTRENQRNKMLWRIT